MKVGFVSLGCPKNLVDGEVMLGYARDAGHEITADAREADVIVVNTCAFIDEAKEESVDAILEMAQLKREGGAQRLVVTGCLAERYRDQLQAEIPEIDVVLGTGQVPEITGALTGAAPAATPLTLYRDSRALRAQPDAPPANSPAPQAPPPAPRAKPPAPPAKPPAPRAEARVLPTYLYDAETPRLITTPRHFAYIKIAEGCDYTCAFCIIPTLRGQYRSRSGDSIVAEAEALAARGVRELLLISQDTTFFGIDRGERGALAALLRRLNRIDGLAWIRLLYLYPTTITDDVLDAMAECERVCRYVDLPLQHASAGVLRRMRRPGNRQAYDKLLGRIRTRVPDVTLRTTFIVGFPGETADDFRELTSFVEDTGFDHVGVFTYSHEEDTRAYAMPDDVPTAVKRDRRRALMGRQRALVAARNRQRIGQEVTVMVDGPVPGAEPAMQGRLAGQAPDIDPVVYLSECDPDAARPGQLIRARITDARDYDLAATCLL